MRGHLHDSVAHCIPADVLSCTTPSPALDVDLDLMESNLIHVLHGPLQAAIFLHNLRPASEKDLLLSQLRTFIQDGWSQVVPGELGPLHQVKEELSCCNHVCMAWGTCTVVPSSLWSQILAHGP